MSRLRALPWVVGVVLLAGTAIGANRLFNPDDAPSPGGGAAPPKNGKPAGPSLTGGTIALGTVDSVPSPVRIGPPSVSAIATVARVFPKEGAEVKPGDPLVQFDDAIFQAKLREAGAELAAAQHAIKMLDVAKKLHEINLQRLEDAQKSTVNLLNFTKGTREIIDDGIVKGLPRTNVRTGAPYTEAEKAAELAELRRQHPDLRKLEASVIELEAKYNDQTRQLEAARLTTTEDERKQALAKIDRLKATVEEAQAAVNACLIKARDVGGVVELVKVGPGTTIGPGTREPLMILVPAGRRIVRAEVDAEFAYKWAGREGQKAVVTDASNFTLTYDGTVTRIGTAFLPKRSAMETLTVNPVYVLECEIEVADPAPPNKAPLRVGQPVRVTIP